jgi:hypothetical protein
LSLPDVAGLIGVVLVLAAYGGAALGKFAASGVIPLTANLAGALLILLSLIHTFNLSAFVMEATWGLVAVAGLIRLALKRRP